jgi:hypothetical protein
VSSRIPHSGDRSTFCSGASGNRIDCRQEKRDVKQDARGEAWDGKKNDDPP